MLKPGWYVYSGSANGPGGIRARVGRHMRRAKRQHWHIDGLTGFADKRSALVLPGGSECALVHAMEATGRFAHPAPGFGSTDCRACASHLLEWLG